MDKIKGLLEQGINEIAEKGIDTENIDTLEKLVDIHSKIIEEKEREANIMRYRERDYGARRRDSRGRYMRGGNYGGNYGHEMPDEYIERMVDGYADYRDGMEEYRRGGSYGAKDKSMEALEYMLDGVVCFFEMLQDSSESQEEVELIKKYARKIKEM